MSHKRPYEIILARMTELQEVEMYPANAIRAIIEFLDSHAKLFTLSPNLIMSEGLINEEKNLEAEVKADEQTIAADEAKITDLENKPGADLSGVTADVSRLEGEVEGTPDAPVEAAPVDAPAETTDAPVDTPAS